MVSHLHQELVEVFRRRPELAAQMLSGPLDTDLSKWEEARAEPNELARQAPPSYLADLVVSLRTGGKPVQAVIVEVQLSRDPEKRRRWPVYVAMVHDELECPTYLLVVCPDPRLAQWCAHPIPLGHPAFTLTPLVLGPDLVPVMTKEQGEEDPELAVLSVLAHWAGPERERVFQAFVAGLRCLETDRASFYADVVAAALPAAVRRSLEVLLMDLATYEPRSDLFRPYFLRAKAQGRAEGKAEGKAEGEAEAVLTVLAARGIEVPDELRERITGCTDLDQLETWIRRSATVKSVEELFG